MNKTLAESGLFQVEERKFLMHEGAYIRLLEAALHAPGSDINSVVRNANVEGNLATGYAVTIWASPGLIEEHAELVRSAIRVNKGG